MERLDAENNNLMKTADPGTGSQGILNVEVPVKETFQESMQRAGSLSHNNDNATPVQHSEKEKS